MMDKKLTKSMKIWSPQNKQAYHTVQTVTDSTINTNITYYLPAFLAVNTLFTSLYALIRIHY